MTSKDLSNEKRLQREDKLNLKPRVETEGYPVSGARETISTGGSTAEGLPAKSSELRPRTHGGVIRQLIEQSMAQLAEDKAALDVLKKRIDRTQQGVKNLEGLLENWQESTQLTPEE